MPPVSFSFLFSFLVNHSLPSPTSLNGVVFVSHPFFLFLFPPLDADSELETPDFAFLCSSEIASFSLVPVEQTSPEKKLRSSFPSNHVLIHLFLQLISHHLILEFYTRRVRAQKLSPSPFSHPFISHFSPDQTVLEFFSAESSTDVALTIHSQLGLSLQKAEQLDF
ncbi:hypothetical protein DFH11DRAFT_223044 [Phellopilus nigrolimitatus]|nr:hypothetical protein DFH11DRAFT_223044 [Phellopilus nigrolimitatus]